jgi:hypothetical protein
VCILLFGGGCPKFLIFIFRVMDQSMSFIVKGNFFYDGQTHPWMISLRTISPKFIYLFIYKFYFYYCLAPHGLCVTYLCTHNEKFVSIYISYTSKNFVFIQCFQTCVLEILKPLSLSVKLHHCNYYFWFMNYNHYSISWYLYHFSINFEKNIWSKICKFIYYLRWNFKPIFFTIKVWTSKLQRQWLKIEMV